MAKRNIIIIVLVILLISVVYLVFKIRDLREYPSNQYLTAIPITTPLLLETHNFEYTLNKINSCDSLLEQLNWIESIESTRRLIKILSDVPTLFPSLNNELKTVAISIDLCNDTICCAFYASFKNPSEQRIVTNQIKKSSQIVNISTIQVPIFKVTGKNHDETIFTLIQNGVIVCSTNINCIIKSYEQLSKTSNLTQSPKFSEAQKTASKDAFMNLFINLEELNNLLESIIEKDNLTLNLSEWGSWAALDIDLQKNSITTNGLTTNQTSLKNNLLDKLSEISPSTSEGLSQLPNETLYAIVYNFGSNPNLNLASCAHDLSLVDSSVLALITSELTMAHIKFDSVIHKFLVIKTENQTESTRQLNNLLDTLQTGKISPETTFSPDEHTEIPIYRGFTNNKLSTQLSFLFTQCPDKYYTHIENQIVFSDSIEPLIQYINQKILNKTLKNDPTFKQYISLFPKNSSIHIYCSPSYFPQLIEENATLKTNIKLENAISSLANFFGIGLQISVENNSVLISQNALYTANRESKPTTNWERKLDSTVIMKPLIIQNPRNKEKEIIIQDLSNKLYRINSKGSILWEKKLESQIIGDIQLINLDNGIVYLAFSVGDKVYVLDIDGNNKPNFPLTLSCNITNPLSIIYNADTYKLAVACENKTVLMFNHKGNKITDWNFQHTETVVTKPIQYFKDNNTTYLIIKDNKNQYIVNEKGKLKLPLTSLPTTSSNFVLLNNTLIALSLKGEIITLNLPSYSIEKHKIDLPITESMQLKVVSNTDKTLLISDKHNIFYTNHLGEIIWQKHFDEGIIGNPDVYNFGERGKKIGLSTNLERIHLFNSDGSYMNSFPLVGISRFSITKLEANSQYYSLFVGGKHHFFYNYTIAE